MKIWKIASAIIEQDEEILKAAHIVVDQNKSIGSVLDLFGWDHRPDKIDELGDMVMELRKMATLPVDKILQIYDKLVLNTISVSKMAKRNGIDVDDFVWVIRRKRPQASIHPTEKEIKEIIALKTSRAKVQEIVKKTRINSLSINNILRKYAPHLIRDVVLEGEYDDMYLEYLEHTENEGKSDEESIQLVMDKHNIPFDKMINVKRRFRDRGRIVRESPRPVTEEEIKKIMEMASLGINANKIGAELNRSRGVILNVIKKIDPQLYEKKYKRNSPKEPKDSKDSKVFPKIYPPVQQEKIEVPQQIEQKKHFELPKIEEDKIEGLIQQLDFYKRKEKETKEKMPDYVSHWSKRREELEEYLKGSGVIAKTQNWYKIAKMFLASSNIKLYRGESVYNKKGKFYTTDKEWARQFTQSGLDNEIKTIIVPENLIFKGNPLPSATNEEEFYKAVEEARKNGFRALWIDEGPREPNSVYFI